MLLIVFWSKVQIPDDIVNDCWVWLGTYCGSKKYTSYGHFWINDGFKQSSHRFSYDYYHGPIYDNLFVRHTCDNPKCVNPNHLILGTHQDNMNDMCSRNRQAKGELNGLAKLTEDDVRDILENTKLEKYTNLTEIGEQYNVCTDTIRRIFIGKNWKHITRDYDDVLESLHVSLWVDRTTICGEQLNSKLTEIEVREIKYHLACATLSHRKLAKAYNVSKSTITAINTGRLWKHVN